MHGYSMPQKDMVGDSLNKDATEHLANAQRELRAALRALGKYKE